MGQKSGVSVRFSSPRSEVSLMRSIKLLCYDLLLTNHAWKNMSIYWNWFDEFLLGVTILKISLNIWSEKKTRKGIIWTITTSLLNITLYVKIFNRCRTPKWNCKVSILTIFGFLLIFRVNYLYKMTISPKPIYWCPQYIWSPPKLAKNWPRINAVSIRRQRGRERPLQTQRVSRERKSDN